MFKKWIRQRSEVPTDSLWRSEKFSCKSLKDIEDLLYEDFELEFYPTSRRILRQARSPRFPGYPSRRLELRSTVKIPDADNGDLVIYFTSLAFINKIFEDCRTVKSILRGFRIPIDERNVAADFSFWDELNTIFGTKNIALPQVFVGGEYIGGAEEIKQLQERGELKEIISQLAPRVHKFIRERSLFKDFTSDEEDQKVDPLEKERYRKQAMESCGFYFDDDIIHPIKGIYPTECTDRDHLGKIGLHCYNIEKGTNLQFIRLLKCYAAETDVQDFYLTLEVMDPVDNSVHMFETRVWYVGWEDEANLVLRTTICRLKPQVAGLGDAQLCWDFDAIDFFYKGDIPGWLPDDALTGSDKLQFYELTESEIKENEWLKIYAETVIYSVWLRDTSLFGAIEMKKIVVQTKEDVVSSMKLKSNNAIFYLIFKAAHVLEDMKAVVRKTTDGLTGHLSLAVLCFTD